MKKLIMRGIVGFLLMGGIPNGGLGAAENPCETVSLRTNLRPNPEDVTKVSIGLQLTDLSVIDDVNQTMTVDLLGFMHWVDPRLAPYDGCKLDAADVWTPTIEIVNSGRVFPKKSNEIRVGPGGSVMYVQRFFGTIATYHNLHSFPFDKQEFEISFFPIDYGVDEINFELNEKVVTMKKVLNIEDWKVLGVEGEIQKVHWPISDKFHSVFVFKIKAERNQTYYWWKVILPLCLIVAMSWAVFWINPAQFGPQIGLSATSMLTLIAFIFATTNMVPKLGYLTTLDRFIVGAIILVFLALVESVLTAYLFSVDKKQAGLLIDRLCRWIFPLGFLGIIVFYLIRPM